MNIKLVAIDLDGTTFDNKSQISKENITAIKKALDKGVEVVPCTGRAYFEMPKDILDINEIKYAVLSNGGAVVNMRNNNKIYSNELDFDTATRILEITKEYDCLIEIYYKGQPYSQTDKINNLSRYLIEDKYHDVLTNTRKLVKNIPDFFNENCKSAEKLNLFFADLNERKSFWNRMNDFSDKIEITSSMTSNVEINKVGANKGDGLKKLCETLNINMKDVIAIGDSDNDLTMLKEAGIAIAVENAMDSVKEIADEITVKNTDHAIEKVLKKYLHI